MKRKKAWKKAAEFVNPIVEQHGLKEARTGVNPFTTSEIRTPVEQHVETILIVAEWLLEGE